MHRFAADDRLGSDAGILPPQRIHDIPRGVVEIPRRKHELEVLILLTKKALETFRQPRLGSVHRFEHADGGSRMRISEA